MGQCPSIVLSWMRGDMYTYKSVKESHFVDPEAPGEDVHCTRAPSVSTQENGVHNTTISVSSEDGVDKASTTSDFNTVRQILLSLLFEFKILEILARSSHAS